eukprot:7035763-Pyramimonas_sp.AAC.1
MGNYDEDDYCKYLAQKLNRALDRLQDKNYLMSSSLAAWSSEDLDHLWHSLEAADHDGDSIRLVANPAISPFRRCMGKLEI